MTYEEALEKIHSFEVFGSKLGMERMNKLLSLLGNPEEGLRIIHVAGTNGKGSVCRYLYAVLSEAGYRVGVYLSPYVERFTERIECAGEEISETELARHTETVTAAAERMIREGWESPTEFEVVTAIGFLHFAAQETDFVILEVGLGGRGDSTNVCRKPLVTAITSISYDHMAVLGNTLPEIAREKAGIIKDGVPVVVMVRDPAARNVIEEVAAARRAPYIDAAAVPVSDVRPAIDGYTFSTDRLKDVKPGMTGRHQVDNAVCALTVLETLRDAGVSIPEDAIYRGMAKARQPVRFEVFGGFPPFILDGAHNQAGVEALVRTAREVLAGRRILLCTGILGDKDYAVMARELRKLDADILVTRVPVPRGMAASDLADAFRKAGNTVIAVEEDYREAFRRSVELAERTAGGADGKAAPAPDPLTGAADTAAGDVSKPESAADSEASGRAYDAVIWAGSIYLTGAIRTLLKEYRDGRYKEQGSLQKGSAVL